MQRAWKACSGCARPSRRLSKTGTRERVGGGDEQAHRTGPPDRLTRVRVTSAWKPMCMAPVGAATLAPPSFTLKTSPPRQGGIHPPLMRDVATDWCPTTFYCFPWNSERHDVVWAEMAGGPAHAQPGLASEPGPRHPGGPWRQAPGAHDPRRTHGSPPAIQEHMENRA